MNTGYGSDFREGMKRSMAEPAKPKEWKALNVREPDSYDSVMATIGKAIAWIAAACFAGCAAHEIYLRLIR